MYRIIDVDEKSAKDLEYLGSKVKFWFNDRHLGRCLFKLTRQTAGEDWSEKIAAECAERLGLPHASYELANSQKGRGVVSPSFVPEKGTLIHGNELLFESVPDYPRRRSSYRVSQHTIELVLHTIDQNSVGLPIDWMPIEGVSQAAEVFAGYILLDTLIGNTDRHHENWGLIDTREQTRHLAPTFDHASSLGRNEPEEKVKARLIGNDLGYTVERYAEKCHSRFYLKAGDTKPLTTFEVFQYVSDNYPAAAKRWLDQLALIEEDELAAIFAEIPNHLISDVAAQFALGILRFNRRRLLQMRR